MPYKSDDELNDLNDELLQVKCDLYGEPMRQLIAGQIEESTRNIKRYLTQSNGEFRDVFVQVDVEGISAEQYFSWQSAAMRDAISGTPEERRRVTEEVLFPAHPEHYMILGRGVIETLGGLPTNAGLTKVDVAPDFLEEAIDPSYFGGKNNAVTLSDGTIWSYGVTQYKDVPGGASMKLHVFWPAACPQIYFDDHARHFSVEYRNFIHMAYESLMDTGNVGPELRIRFKTSAGEADEDRVNEWEKLATYRALRNLHTLLGE